MRHRKELSSEEQELLDNTLRIAAIKMRLQRKQKMPKEVKRMIIKKAISEIERMRKLDSGKFDLKKKGVSGGETFSWVESVGLSAAN